jgi:hypothetical protein
MRPLLLTRLWGPIFIKDAAGGEAPWGPILIEDAAGGEAPWGPPTTWVRLPKYNFFGHV